MSVVIDMACSELLLAAAQTILHVGVNNVRSLESSGRKKKRGGGGWGVKGVNQNAITGLPLGEPEQNIEDSYLNPSSGSILIINWVTFGRCALVCT